MSGRYTAVGPQSETVVGGVVGVDEFIRKGHQTNIELENVDALIAAVRKKASDVPEPGALQTWDALLNEWRSWFHENIQNVPFFPWQSTDELERWLARAQEWKARAQAWAEKSAHADLKTAAKAIPTSPAEVTRKEDMVKKAAEPPWVKLGFAAVLLLGAGWIASSVARVLR